MMIISIGPEQNRVLRVLHPISTAKAVPVCESESEHMKLPMAEQRYKMLDRVCGHTLFQTCLGIENGRTAVGVNIDMLNDAFRHDEVMATKFQSAL